MKKTMKNQRKSKRFPMWGLKGLLSVALTALGIAAFAQGAEVCRGTGYTIANAVEASPGSEYRWLENGNVLAGTNQATFDVPNNKAAGVYTYIRQSKSTDCPDWQSSNEFTVTVFDCAFTIPDPGAGATATFTDPRDGKQYKTVRMPDDRIWFAQNLNYTQGLTYNAYAREANGKAFTSSDNGAPAIGSYWCPGTDGTYSGDQNTCNIYGALYTWETAMMVDGKYADETKTSSAWDEAWVTSYYFNSGAYGTEPNADKNNAQGGTYTKGGGRGICPKGWHIPTAREWTLMLDAVGGDDTFTSLLASHSTHIGTIAGQLKSTLPGMWDPAYCTNATGFSWLPAGCRAAWAGPGFVGHRWASYLHTSTVHHPAYCFMVETYDAASMTPVKHSRPDAITLRCIKDL